MIRFLRTDEELEAVNALEMMCEQLPKTAYDPYYWKWVVIALHNSLQGYMVLALKGSDSLNVLTKKSEKERIKARKKKKKVDRQPRLDEFLNLYQKIQSGREVYEKMTEGDPSPDRKESDLMMMYVHSKPFKPQGTQTDSVQFLNELRNEFIHFSPGLASLDTGDWPEMVRDCLDIIAFLAFECGNIYWHRDGLDLKTRDLIKKAKEYLQTVTVN